jgi:hypothetical protein
MESTSNTAMSQGSNYKKLFQRHHVESSIVLVRNRTCCKLTHKTRTSRINFHKRCIQDWEIRNKIAAS